MKFLYLLTLLFLSATLTAQKLKPKVKNGLYGFSLDKEMIIECQFDTVDYHYNQKYFVRKDGLWGVVSIDPTKRIPCKYESIQSWVSNEYLVSNNGLYGIIDSAGLVIWDLIYQEIDHTRGDSLALVKHHGKWVYYKNGQAIYNEDDFYFTKPDRMPLFPGCDPSLPYEELKKCSVNQMYKYIFENVHYPALARDMGIQGMVVIEFMIDKNGQIKNLKILRELGGGINEESLKVVGNMPAWTPGMEDGRIVKTTFVLPIKYIIK